MFPSVDYGEQGHKGGFYQPETLSDYDIQHLSLPRRPPLTQVVHIALQTINGKLSSSGQKKNGIWSRVVVGTHL